MKQIVIVLFLAATAGQAEMLRLEASVDAMGSTFSVILYDESRSRMAVRGEPNPVAVPCRAGLRSRGTRPWRDGPSCLMAEPMWIANLPIWFNSP